MRPSFADIRLLAGADFEDDDPDDLAVADAASEWFSLPGGWALFAQGEPSEHFYMLVSGALVAHRELSTGATELVGYIRAGEPVGEMGLISGEPHSATVSALRDSEILSLPREEFQRLMRTVPAFQERLTRLMLQRARETRRGRPRGEPRVFALIATSPSIDVERVARQLARAIAGLGRSCLVAGPEAEAHPPAWFDEVERAHDVVLLHARMSDVSWYRMCLRHADRLWVTARRDSWPSRPFPLAPDERSPARRFRLVDMVIIDEGQTTGAPAREWMEATGAMRLMHWRDESDLKRLARVALGRSVGLVLSGGGARAYAHIGAIRALREAGLPIDLAGGASMGAIVAAGLAMGWSDDELEVRVRNAFVASNPLGDLTLPVVALAKGRRVEQRLQAHFGDAAIEDLRIPFFCVSSDLSYGRSHVHAGGRLRDALRASIAIPGILPPVVTATDEVLVDGAVFNNFPVDVMRLLHRGPTIGIDVTRQRGLNGRDFKDPPGFLSWVLQHGLTEPPPIASLLIRAATVHIDFGAHRRDADCLIAPELAEIELRDWKRFDDAVAAGYVAAARAIANPPPALADALAMA